MVFHVRPATDSKPAAILELGLTPEESDQNSFAELPKNEQNRIQSTLRFLEEDAYSDNEEESDNAVKFNLDHFSKHYIEMDTSSESVDSNTNGNLLNASLNHLVFTDYRGREVWNQFEIGVIHEISKHLPTTIDGFDQIMETICRYTYNCYWKGSSHPFIEHIASKLQLPKQVVPRCIRTLGSFVNALQS